MLEHIRGGFSDIPSILPDFQTEKDGGHGLLTEKDADLPRLKPLNRVPDVRVTRQATPRVLGRLVPKPKMACLDERCAEEAGGRPRECHGGEHEVVQIFDQETPNTYLRLKIFTSTVVAFTTYIRLR